MAAAYPDAPGAKARDGASQDAADAMATRADFLRNGVLECLAIIGPMTSDEAASLMGESVLSIRPRFSELGARGIIEKTAGRRSNASGHKATVWQLAIRAPEAQAA